MPTVTEIELLLLLIAHLGTLALLRECRHHLLELPDSMPDLSGDLHRMTGETHGLLTDIVNILAEVADELADRGAGAPSTSGGPIDVGSIIPNLIMAALMPNADGSEERLRAIHIEEAEGSPEVDSSSPEATPE